MRHQVRHLGTQGKAEGSLPARYQNGMAKGRQTSSLAASGLDTKDVQGLSLQAYSSSKKSALTLHPARDSQPTVTSFCPRDCSVPASCIQAKLNWWHTCPGAVENELAHVNQSLKMLKSIREATACDSSLQGTLSPTPTSNCVSGSPKHQALMPAPVLQPQGQNGSEVWQQCQPGRRSPFCPLNTQLVP